MFLHIDSNDVLKMHLGEDDSGSDFEEQYKDEYIRSEGALPGSSRYKKNKKMSLGAIIANENSSSDNESSGNASDNLDDQLDSAKMLTDRKIDKFSDSNLPMFKVSTSKRLSMMKDYEKFIKNRSVLKRHASVGGEKKSRLLSAPRQTESVELNLSESSSEDETSHCSTKLKRVKKLSNGSNVFNTENKNSLNMKESGMNYPNLQNSLAMVHQDSEMATQLESLAMSYTVDDQAGVSWRSDKGVVASKLSDAINETSDINKLLSLGEGVSVEDADESLKSEGNQNLSTNEGNGSIEITLQDTANSLSRLKKKSDPHTQIMNEIKRMQRLLRIMLHKCSFLCHLSHLIYMNSYLGAPGIVNENRKQLLLAVGLSIVPAAHATTSNKLNMVRLSSFVSWFRDAFPILTVDNKRSSGCITDGMLFEKSPEVILQRSLSNFVCERKEHLVFIFILAARALGWNTRLIMNIDTIPIKSDTKSEKTNIGNIQSEKIIKDYDNKCRIPPDRRKGNDKHKLLGKKSKHHKPKKSINLSDTKFDEIPQLDGLNDFNQTSCSSSNQKSSAKNHKSSPKKVEKISRNKYEPDENYKNKCRTVAATIKQIRQRRKMEQSQKGMTDTVKKENIDNRQRSNDKDIDKVKEQKRLSTKALSEAESRRASTTAASNQYLRKLCSDSDTEESSDNKRTTNQSSVTKTSHKKRSNKTASVKSRKNPSESNIGSTFSATKGCQYWAEVYIDPKWVTVDLISGRIDCPAVIEQNLFGKITKGKNKSIINKSGQILYVVAANIDGSLKDVTKRYTSNKYMTVTRKTRAPVEEWITRTLRPFKSNENSKQGKTEIAENIYLERALENAPMPKSLGAFKNHPFYALKKDLNQKQAIFPNDAPTLGFIQGHGIYARECVHELQNRTSWLKHGLVVKIGEIPYKVVTPTNPRYDKMLCEKVSNEPVELFGKWQTEKYIPPAAKDGKVPRNEYGNVELFKPWMLPKGTIHVPIQGLSRIAKKLNIDCAPAMVGWEFSNGSMRPVYDGFVICEEANDYIMDAWNQEMDEQMKKEALKREKRAIDNWTKLVRGMLLYQKIAKKYSKNKN